MSSLVSGAANILTQGATNALNALLGPSFRPDDALFVQTGVYFFELRVPRGGGSLTPASYVVPLALNPENISFSEPFTVQSTPTLGGGLVVEESGMVSRSIHIRGSTGSYQRAYTGDVDQLKLVSSADRDFGRSLSPTVLGVLSGQKIYQYLEDSVFRVYSSLKKDPAMASGTSLIFHMPRESEAWTVVPTRFGSDRSASRPLDYPYEIELLVVQKAELNTSAFSQAKPTLDALRNPLKVAANFLQRATAAVNALTAAQGQLRNYFRQLDVILVQAGALTSAVGAFVSGAADIINVPASTVRVLAGTIGQTLATFVATQGNLEQVPQVYEQSLRQLQAACFYISLHPGSFAQANAAARAAVQAVAAYNAAQAAALQAQIDGALPTTLAQASAQGTRVTPEQAAQILTSVGAGGDVVAYTGAHPYRVQAGDTLSNLAARYLGDARRWRYIAAANNLRPPYAPLQATLALVPQGAPADVGSLNLGDTLLIPDFSTPNAEQQNLSTLGVPTDASSTERVFGTDLALSAKSSVKTDSRALADGERLDWVVDSTSGGTALTLASGIDNLTQGVLTRISLTKGDDPFFQNLGVAPVVGSGLSAVDGQTLAFNLRSAITADPRIAQVTGLTVQRSASGDGLSLVGNLQAKSYADPVPLSIPLSGA